MQTLPSVGMIERTQLVDVVLLSREFRIAHLQSQCFDVLIFYFRCIDVLFLFLFFSKGGKEGV